MTEPTSRRLLGVVTACLSLFLFAISAALLPAALLRASSDLGVMAELVAWTVVTQFVSSFFAIIIGGMLGDRFGMKPVLLSAAVLLGIGALVWALTHSLITAHVGAALMGMGGGVLEGLGSALLAALFPDRRALVLNVSQAVYCGGAAAAPAVMAILLPLGVGWRVFFAAEAGLGLLLLGLYYATPMPSPVKAMEGNGSALTASFESLRHRNVLLLALSLFCYVLVESGVALFLGLHMQKYLGAPERWAVLGLSAFWGAMLVGRLICAFLPDRVVSIRFLCAFALAAALMLMILSLTSNWMMGMAIIIIAGLCLSGLWPGIVALTARGNQRRTASAMGAVIATGSLGVAVAPMVATVVAGFGGSYHYFAVMGMVLLSVIPLLGAAANAFDGGVYEAR